MKSTPGHSSKCGLNPRVHKSKYSIDSSDTDSGRNNSAINLSLYADLETVNTWKRGYLGSSRNTDSIPLSNRFHLLQSDPDKSIDIADDDSSLIHKQFQAVPLNSVGTNSSSITDKFFFFFFNILFHNIAHWLFVHCITYDPNKKIFYHR